LKTYHHHWYALSTRSHFEKKIANELKLQNYDVFLPLSKETRKWSDRIKKIEVPLLRSYVFVKTHPSDYYHFTNILHVPGAVRFVSFEGKPAVVADSQIEFLQRLCETGYPIQEIQVSFLPGTPVEILHGPLKGIKGTVIHANKKNLLIIRLDIIDKNIQVTLPEGIVGTQG